MRKLSILMFAMLLATMNAFSQSATVTILTQPTDVIDCKGEDDNVLAVIGSTTSGELQFQWQRDGVDLVAGVDFAGATNENGLVLGELEYGMSGLYTCMIWSDEVAGSNTITTEPVAIHVLQTPSITRNPMGMATDMGAVAMLEVDGNFRGEMPDYEVSVQWYRDDSPVTDNEKYSGANSSVLLINMVDADDYTAEFHVVIDSKCGQVTSPKTSIKPMPGVTISEQPSTAASEVCAGENVIVTIGTEVTGDGMMDEVTYQWYRNMTLLNDDANHGGTKSATLTTKVEEGSNDYYCHVAYGRGGEEMPSDMVSVMGTPVPMFSADVDDVEVNEGEMVMVMVPASNDDGNFTYEWYMEGMTDAVGTGATFTIDAADTTDGGTYYAMAMNECGDDMSNTFSITVNTSEVTTGIFEAEKFSLMNTPNPVDGVTTISFELTNTVNSSLVVTDVQGNRIAEFNNLKLGVNTIEFDANRFNLSNGVYFYTLTTGNDRATAKMIINR